MRWLALAACCYSFGAWLSMICSLRPGSPFRVIVEPLPLGRFLLLVALTPPVSVALAVLPSRSDAITRWLVTRVWGSA
jgi:hypothetical protein